ncbi:MAG: ribulose-phosphate 3-epimerase [Candidatus Omnitrophota bacterium]
MIVPALLTDKKDELIRMVNFCATFTDYVQIDIMDGEFVPSQSVKLRDLKDWKLPLRSEAHLMVSDPCIWLPAFKTLGVERIIYHFEAVDEHQETIAKIKALGLGVGLAINPSTEIDEFQSLVNEVDTILFLSVNPGFYGAAFIPRVLEKIRNFKNRYPQMQAGVDGGIKRDNLVEVKRSGVDYICVGSAILKSIDPAKSYVEFMKLFNG